MPKLALQEFDPHLHEDIQCEYSRIGNDYRVRFCVPHADTWDLDCEHSKNDFVIGLWEHSCFELFEFNEESAEYVEWNISPTGAYWFCEFEDYRKTKAHFELRVASDFKAILDGNNFIVEVLLPSCFEKARVQLNCVLENAEGKLFYFAHRHPAHKADFHLKLL
ncbi:hypothetical protein GW915_10485 [bacterium]|nr:hypothetical protein [bacterium]